VGHLTFGHRPGIRINELPSRGNPNGFAVERKELLVFHEMKNMCMAAAEFLGAADAESVIPDDPAAAMEANFLEKDFQLGCKFIPDREPKSAGGFQPSINLLAPELGPSEIIIGLAPILVSVVLIADVEWRVGESQIDRAGFQARHARDAISVMELVGFH